jgi:hypothetical protein
LITPPQGWTQHHGEHLVTLYPPGGGARIRFYERLRPLMRFSRVIEAVLERDPLFRVSSLHDAQTVTTLEGEYGAWVRVSGTREGVAATRFIGAVFGDEFVGAIDAFVLDVAQTTAIEQTARDLLASSTFALGTRRRRFLYQPPEHWCALQSGLVANWYPPDFPRNRANLVVLPAEPTHQTPYELIDVVRLLAAQQGSGGTLAGEVEDVEIRSSSGLVGRRCAFTVRRGENQLQRHELAAFVSGPYAYRLRLESHVLDRAAEHHQVFLETVRSVVAVPEPETGRAGTTPPPDGSLSYWAD